MPLIKGMQAIQLDIHIRLSLLQVADMITDRKMSTNQVEWWQNVGTNCYFDDSECVSS